MNTKPQIKPDEAIFLLALLMECGIDCLSCVRHINSYFTSSFSQLNEALVAQPNGVEPEAALCLSIASSNSDSGVRAYFCLAGFATLTGITILSFLHQLAGILREENTSVNKSRKDGLVEAFGPLQKSCGVELSKWVDYLGAK